MSTTPSPGAAAEQAVSLLQRLEGFRRELQAAANPHMQPLRHLGLTNTFNGTAVPYHADAFEPWNELRRRKPDDWETVHHLAIMHHARAMDLEASGEPAKSDADWTTAMELWHQLWVADPYWQHLATLTSRTISLDVWKQVRDQLPVWLLTIHYDIALDLEQTKVHRAKFHLGLAHGAAFSAEVRRAVQREAYTRFISVVPPAVWQFEERNPETIKQGTDRIERFLALDPGCLPALEDALRLATRLLSAWKNDLDALGDDETRGNKLLRMIKGAAEHWRPYFAQMLGRPEIDDEIRQKLGHWYHLMGQVHSALDQAEAGIGFYTDALTVLPQEETEYQRCTDNLVEAQGGMAIKLARGRKPNARRYCDEMRNRQDLTIEAHRLLAIAYAEQRDLDAAEAECVRGLALEPRDMDDLRGHETAVARLTNIREQIQQARG